MVEYNYKDLFNSLGDSVLICNLNYGKTLGNFYNSNSTASIFLGYSIEELRELDLLKVSANNFEKELTNIIDLLISEGKVYFDFSFRKKNGEIVTAEINAVLFNCHDNPSVILTARNSASRLLVEEQFKTATEQLRNLALHIQSIREEERKTIAREIHDELGQVLTVLKIQISLLSKKLRDDQKELKDKIATVSAVIDDTVESVQRISSKLRPDILDELGLAAAIEWQAQEFSKNTGIVCDCYLMSEDINLDHDAATAVFRIYQEALTNVARHANAGKILIKLSPTLNHIVLEITDNGKGITQNQIVNPKSFGLLGMKERALLFGGKVIIKSTMKRGTTVLVEIPVEQPSGVNYD